MDRKILIDLLDDFAFGSHNIEQTADRITELYKQEQALKLQQTGVMRCGLSEAEFTERELLLELQRNSQRWFSKEEFDRLKELSNKMFANAGPPHIA